MVYNKTLSWNKMGPKKKARKMKCRWKKNRTRGTSFTYNVRKSSVGKESYKKRRITNKAWKRKYYKNIFNKSKCISFESTQLPIPWMMLVVVIVCWCVCVCVCVLLTIIRMRFEKLVFCWSGKIFEFELERKSFLWQTYLFFVVGQLWMLLEIFLLLLLLHLFSCLFPISNWLFHALL